MTDRGLGFLDVLMAKEKLAIEVTQVDCIKVDDVNVSKAGEHEVF